MELQSEIVKEFIRYYKNKGMKEKDLKAVVEQVFLGYPEEMFASCFEEFNMMYVVESDTTKRKTNENEEQISLNLKANEKETENTEMVSINIPKTLLAQIKTSDKTQGVIEAIKDYYGIYE